MRRFLIFFFLSLAVCGLGLFTYFRSQSWESLIINTSDEVFVSSKISWLHREYIRIFHPISSATTNDRGQWPLHFAINGCHGKFKQGEYCLELIQEIINTGGDVNAPSNDHLGLAPLHLAVLYKDLELAKFLLQVKADPNAEAGGKRYKGMTPLRFGQELVGKLNPEELTKQKLVESIIRAHGGKDVSAP